MASANIKKYNNRLANEKSPYLLQHANNPVDWYPWGEEAFQAAKDEKKLIFLSVGYSTCHWCHVMERESFENEEIAKIMNENFINIKVDREERPDVDKVYMTFITASSGRGGWPMSVFMTSDFMPVAGGTYYPPYDRYGLVGFSTLLKTLSERQLSGRGGWPMSVFLTPELKPVYGGTYYPPENRYYGQPGFSVLLKSLSLKWKTDEQKFVDSGHKIMEVLNRVSQISTSADAVISSEECAARCFAQFIQTYEPEYGGFSESPKFPQPSNFNFLFTYYLLMPSKDNLKKAKRMALHTLDMMNKGGIHDHISQGFARYSTDKKWHVPHFEKMLYDQAQLAMSYIDAFLITGDEEYSDVVRDIITYVGRDLSDPCGGFYSAEDADSLPNLDSEKKKEGAFCVWSFNEIEELLSSVCKNGSLFKLSDLFCYYYSVKKEGNVNPYQDPHDELKGKNVLTISCTVDNLAEKFTLSKEECSLALKKSKEILYNARQERPRPHLDNKMLTAWNGMMLNAVAKAGSVLNDKSYIDRAVKTGMFIKNNLWSDNKLYRVAYASENGVTLGSKINGFVDDYAWIIRGCVSLYEATFNDEWLEWATQLQEIQNLLFWDDAEKGFLMTDSSDSSLILKIKEDQDGAEPSANSVSALNLITLGHYLDRKDFLQKADNIFQLFSTNLEKIPLALPEMLTALLLRNAPQVQIILSGNAGSPSFRKMKHAVATSLCPGRTVFWANPNTNSFTRSLLPKLQNYISDSSECLAYVCQNFTCSLPVKSSEALKTALTKSILKT